MKFYKRFITNRQHLVLQVQFQFQFPGVFHASRKATKAPPARRDMPIILLRLFVCTLPLSGTACRWAWRTPTRTVRSLRSESQSNPTPCFPLRIKRNENCRALRGVKSNQPTCQIPLYYKNRNGGKNSKNGRGSGTITIEALTGDSDTFFNFDLVLFHLTRQLSSGAPPTPILTSLHFPPWRSKLGTHCSHPAVRVFHLCYLFIEK